MAFLTNCPLCGREKVSSECSSCPDCGHNIADHLTKSKVMSIVGREKMSKELEQKCNLVAKLFNYPRENVFLNTPQHDLINRLSVSEIQNHIDRINSLPRYEKICEREKLRRQLL
jgi:hypothetical protein